MIPRQPRNFQNIKFLDLDLSRPFEDRLKDTLVVNGYDPAIADFWRAVARHETGRYTSRLFQSDNNAFGMKLPKKRPTTGFLSKRASAAANGFAAFENNQDSIHDLLYYMTEFRYPKKFKGRLADWVAFMKSVGYFEEPFYDYYSGVKRQFDKL